MNGMKLEIDNLNFFFGIEKIELFEIDILILILIFVLILLVNFW